MDHYDAPLSGQSVISAGMCSSHRQKEDAIEVEVTREHKAKGLACFLTMETKLVYLLLGVEWPQNMSAHGEAHLKIRILQV